MILKEYLLSKGVSNQLCDKLIPLFTYKKYNNGETILNAGENTKVICLILSGIVRGFFLNEDGNDVTKCFSKEGDWCCIYNFIKSTSSAYFIEAVEDCQLAEIKVSALKKLMQSYPILQDIYQNLFQDAFIKSESKGTAFQRMSAKERYISFLKDNTEIACRVKQEYIASYLGVTPSSLSRIKREL